MYELHPGKSGSVFGANGERCVNLENWRLKDTLRGHRLNVQDLAWSPPIEKGDKEVVFLASASFDNTLRVYDASRGNDGCVAVLQCHESHVKGCAFDPLGRYLASQGDDAKVVLWSTDNWEPLQQIVHPFMVDGGVKGYVQNNHFTRPGWSADGQALAVPNCRDKEKNAYAQPIIRGRWHEVNAAQQRSLFFFAITRLFLTHLIVLPIMHAPMFKTYRQSPRHANSWVIRFKWLSSRVARSSTNPTRRLPRP